MKKVGKSMARTKSKALSVTVVGDGAWGTALALILHRKGLSVRIWGYDPSYTAMVMRRRENVAFLPKVKIPPDLFFTSDPQEAFPPGTGGGGGVDLVVCAVPTQFLRSVFGGPLGAAVPARVPLVSVSKGIEMKTYDRPSQILGALLPRHPVAVLSGPSHAEEVARGLPTSVVVASPEKGLAQSVQELFSTDRFRAYTNSDPVGVELGGALKNVIAIAAGICDGAKLGDNAKASLLTRGIVEMSRLGAALGGRKATFFGLSGIGDLITTCISPHGRNRGLGERIGRGESLEAILASMVKVVEGVWTTKALHSLARRHAVEMPISTQIHGILFRGKDPRTALRDLMRRRRKSEVEELR